MTTDIDADGPKLTKLQMYASALYEHMDSNSAVVQTSDGPIKVWNGTITDACRTVGIPDGVYKRVTDRLTDLKCFQVLQQGRRNVPSVVALFYPPTQEVWDKSPDESDLTRRPTNAILSAEMKSLRQTMGGVNLGEAFVTIERRLTDLDNRLARLEQVTEERSNA